MTEKRFEMIITDTDGNFYYLDKVTNEKIKSTLTLENKLNELNDENEQLKKSIDCQDKTIKEQCIKLDWASECGVKWEDEFKQWSGR